MSYTVGHASSGQGESWGPLIGYELLLPSGLYHCMACDGESMVPVKLLNACRMTLKLVINYLGIRYSSTNLNVSVMVSISLEIRGCYLKSNLCFDEVKAYNFSIKGFMFLNILL